MKNYQLWSYAPYAGKAAVLIESTDEIWFTKAICSI